MISRFFATLPRIRASRSLLAVAALAAVAIPGTADAARRAGGAYDGTWTTVFATTRGNCSSGYSVPFTVAGTRVASAGGGRVSGSVGRGGNVAVASRSVRPRQRRRTAGRQFRLRPLERHHHRRPLQRHLAGDAQLTFAKSKTARRRPFLPDGPLRFPRSSPAQRGASTITTWRPSNLASCSTLANSATSAFTLSSSFVPISWCAISRPR